MVNGAILNAKTLVNLARNSRSQVSGLPEHPLFGSYFAMRRNILDVLDRALETHERILRFRGIHQTFFLLNDPEAIEHVLQGHYRNYFRGQRSHRELKRFLGAGILTTDGEEWKGARVEAQRFFRPSSLDIFVKDITQVTQKLITRWKADARHGRVLIEPLLTQMMTLTLQASCINFLGYDCAWSEAQTLVADLMDLQTYAYSNLFRVISLPPGPRASSALKSLKRFCKKVIQLQQQGKLPDDTYLAQLLRSSSRSGLEDHVMTLLVTAPENPSNTLTWALHLLANHSSLTDSLTSSLDQLATLNHDTLSDVPLLRRTIQETLRIYPGAWGFEREAIEDDRILGHLIPRGSLVLISPYLLHKNPTFWKKPERFDPDRFLPERAAEIRKNTYLPFGSGPRSCIGNHYAHLVVELVLSLILKEFNPVPILSQDLRAMPLFTLRPKTGLKMYFDQRR